ncbi:MAG TPA: phosphate acetyltransferase [Dermatophilaceae bacterium]|nr:phosphate acetyltransferase [Dermatophilaceae bacterium]
MSRRVLLVPTAHGVGLTATCLGLVHALDARGVDVGFLKPLAQPRADGGPERSTALIRLGTALRPPEPIKAAEVQRSLGEGAVDTLMEDVLALGDPVFTEHDVVVIEGLVPSQDQTYSSRINLALAKALDADVVLVGAAAEEGPASVAEMMAGTEASYRAGEAARVVGAVVNRLPTGDEQEVAAYRDALAARGLRLVGAVPVKTELTQPRIGDVVRALDLKVLNAGDQTRRVRDVIIAAQAVPGMLPLLREGRLVLVPGDRHDVVLSACLAAMNGVPMAGLLLTVGIEPDPRVWELCRPAAATGLPILLTSDFTYEAATAVSTLDAEVPEDDLERVRLVRRTVASGLDEAWLATVPTPSHTPRLSPAAFRRQLRSLAAAAHKRIVLPEGAEPRTLQAAAICHQRGIAQCVLLAPPHEVEIASTALGLTLPKDIQIIDPSVVEDRYVDALVQARKHKGMIADAAREALADTIMYGTIMVHLGEVDGLVSGAVHTTAATVRPALQVLGTKPGSRLVSSVFFMCLPDEVVIYGDCAINTDPDAEGLADIALQSAASARAFGIEPRVAMISFSTGSSGSGSDVEKVAKATQIVRERAPDLAVDGPLQYDAATTMSVAKSKAPHSPVAGRATVFIFPDLNTGNTTYKAVQRSADVISIGPMLQGIAKPVNDLSRGALVEDIVYTIALTAIQAAAE